MVAGQDTDGTKSVHQLDNHGHSHSVSYSTAIIIVMTFFSIGMIMGIYAVASDRQEKVVEGQQLIVPDTPYGIIGGYVIDSMTTKPLSGVLVYVDQPRLSFSAHTSNDGYWSSIRPLYLYQGATIKASLSGYCSEQESFSYTYNERDRMIYSNTIGLYRASKNVTVIIIPKSVDNNDYNVDITVNVYNNEKSAILGCRSTGLRVTGDLIRVNSTVRPNSKMITSPLPDIEYIQSSASNTAVLRWRFNIVESGDYMFIVNILDPFNNIVFKGSQRISLRQQTMNIPLPDFPSVPK